MSNNPNYYSIIPANVRYDKRLSANAKLLYSEITALCNVNGHCWASNNYFAELYDVNIRTITRWVSLLIEFGYIDSVIKYKPNSKEILHRYLSISKVVLEEKEDDIIEEKEDSNVGGGMDKIVRGYRQNCREGIDKNVLDNNTRVNNTNNSSSSKGIPTTSYFSDAIELIDIDDCMIRYFSKDYEEARYQIKRVHSPSGEEITETELKYIVLAFNSHLKSTNILKKTMKDYIKHFKNWLTRATDKTSILDLKKAGLKIHKSQLKK